MFFNTLCQYIIGEDDWNIVMRECGTLSTKWQQLGGYLGIRIGLIEDIKGNYPNDNSACWSETLKHWIHQNYNTARFGLPSWRTLLEAIARVNHLLFKTLAEKYRASGKLSYSKIIEVFKYFLSCILSSPLIYRFGTNNYCPEDVDVIINQMCIKISLCMM
jgi:hypothetical protein